MKYLVSIISILLFFATPLRGQAQPIVTLNNQSEAIKLSGYLCQFEDTEGVISINNIRDTASHWRQLGSDYWQTGYKNNYYWLRLTVTAPEDVTDDWYWWLDASIMHDAQLYAFEGNNLVFADTLGFNYPFYQRNIQSRYPVLSIRPHKGQMLTLYARYHNEIGSIKGFIRLTTKSRFNQTDLKESAFYIGFCTFLLIGCVLSIALCFFWKEKIYAFFAAYILCVLFMTASYKGFCYAWLFPQSPYLAHLFRNIWVLGAIGFFLRFVYALLFDVQKKKRKLGLWVNILTGIFIILAFICFFKVDVVISRPLVSFANITFIASMTTLFVMLFMASRQYKLTALFFLIAFTPLTIVGICIILHNNKIYPNILGQSEMPFVLAQIFEIMFLFAALFKRFQTMKAIQERQEQLDIEAKQQVQDERERISRELHDNVGARLTHLITQIDHVEFRLGRDKSEKNVENTLCRLETIGENARDTMNVLRETIWAVKEEVVSIQLFTAKINSYLQQQFVDNLEFEVLLNAKNDIMLTPGQALNLFRIVQEACQNTFKHATAKHIFITLATSEKHLVISIKDDGNGFNVSKSNGDEQNGLRNMKHRALEIGAAFDIKSCLKDGTEVVIKTDIAAPSKVLFQNT